MVKSIWSTLLTYKFRVLTVAVAGLGFLVLWVADTPNLDPRWAELLKALGVAAITSGVVSFGFEYLTRVEYAGMIREIIRAQFEAFEARMWSKSPEEEALVSFWRPFIVEGARIVVAEDNRRGKEPLIRSADIKAALALYQGLVARYARLTTEDFNVQIDTINKFDPLPDGLPFAHNLVVVAAPGANPLAGWIMGTLKGMDAQTGIVRNGYVFGIGAARKGQYLENPFIVPVEESKEGILDLVDGKINTIYRRDRPRRDDVLSEDACLLIHGVVNLKSGQRIRVLVIAGHSRLSTNEGIKFVLTNATWASSVMNMKVVGTETLLQMRGPKTDRVPLMLGPRPIAR